MKPNKKFQNLDLEFWANIKYISNKKGYSDSLPKGTKLASKIKAPPNIKKIKKHLKSKGVSIPMVKSFTAKEIIDFFEQEKFNLNYVKKKDGSPTTQCETMVDYLKYRAELLNKKVELLLMDSEIAKKEFDILQKRIKPSLPFPQNKQKGNKKVIAYFTSIINMLIENTLESPDFDYDPRKLIMFTKNNSPVRIMSRTVDGAFPSIRDPEAIWEIKEYYFTTTFGSRVADGIYESLLDGLELSEIELNLKKKTSHYLFVDAYYTWWIQGKSYLCRMVDMMHMGLVTEVIFGKEVITRLPEIVKKWTMKNK